MKDKERLYKILDAAELQFLSQKATNEANLSVYLRSAVGVAEHTDIVDEVMRMIQKIAEAEESIKIVKKMKDGRH